MKSGDREVQEEEEGGNNIHQYTIFCYAMCTLSCSICIY